MTGKDLVLQWENLQSEPESKDLSPPEEKGDLEEVPEVAGEAMEEERDTFQPELEPVKPTHIWAKGKGEVSGDLEETEQEFEDPFIITGICKDDLRAPRNRLKVS